MYGLEGGPMSRLVLECRPNEKFELFDKVSGLTTYIKVVFRESGNLGIIFEAPKEVRIGRVKQGNANGNGKPG